MSDSLKTIDEVLENYGIAEGAEVYFCTDDFKRLKAELERVMAAERLDEANWFKDLANVNGGSVDVYVVTKRQIDTRIVDLEEKIKEGEQ